MPDDAAPSSRVTVQQQTYKSAENSHSDNHVNDNNKGSVNKSEVGFLDGFDVRGVNYEFDINNDGNTGGIVGLAVKTIIGNPTVYNNSESVEDLNMGNSISEEITVDNSEASDEITEIIGHLSENPVMSENMVNKHFTKNNQLLRKKSQPNFSTNALNGVKRLLLNTKSVGKVDEGDTGDTSHQDANTEDPISPETIQKLVHIIQNNIFTKVKGLNESTYKDYITLIKTYMALNSDQMESLIQNGPGILSSSPKLIISSLMVVAENYKLKKKTLKARIYFKTMTLKTETESQENEYNVEFKEIENLALPGFSDPILCIDVLKASKTDKSGWKDVLSAEIRLSEIVCNQPVHIPLEEKNMGAWNSTLQGQSSSNNHAVIKACIESPSEHPNLAIPKILCQEILKHCQNILNIDISPGLDNPPDEKSVYRVSVTPVGSYLTPGVTWSYSSMEGGAGREGGASSYIRKSSWETTSPEVKCILSDQIIFSKARSRDPSPGVQNGREKRLSVISNDMIESISDLLSPTKSKKSSLGTQPPADMGYSPSRSKKSSFGNSLLSSMSSSSSQPSKQIRIHDLLDTRRMIVEFEDSQWNVEIKYSPGLPLQPTEFIRLYAHIISTEIATQFDSKFTNSTRTLLEILSQSYVENLSDCIGLAYIKAHNSIPFSQSVLTNLLDQMNFDMDEFSEEIELYISGCMNIIREMRFYKVNDIQIILQNLKYFPEHFQVQSKLIENLEANADKMFSIWLESEEAAVSAEIQADINQMDASKSDALEMKEWIRRSKELKVLSKVMNECLYPDVYKMTVEYMPLFSTFEVNPKQVVGTRMIQKSKEKISENLWSEAVISRFINSYKEFDDNDVKVEYFQQAYNCYSVLRRLVNLVQPHSHIPTQLFQDFSEAWLNLGIKKAKVQIRRLISQARHDEIDAKGPTSMDANAHIPHRDKICEEDIVSNQLISFLGISDTCWKLWEDLTYISCDQKMKCFLLLVDGLRDLENNFIEGKEKLYLDDHILDVVEMTKQVSLLDGLEAKFRQGEIRLARMKTDIEETMDDDIRAKVEKGFEKLRMMEGLLEEEIEKYINIYARTYITQIQRFVTDKTLNKTYEESIVYFLNDLMEQIHKNFEKRFPGKEDRGKTYSKKACLILWNIFEKELTEHYAKKKERNKEKNKPGRFDVIKNDLPDIIQLKQIAITEQIMADDSSHQLRDMEAELEQLTKSTSDLIVEFLRKKEAEECSGTEPDATGISFKIGYIKSEDKVVLEIKSIFKLRLGAKEKLNLEFRTNIFPFQNHEKTMQDQRKPFQVHQESHIFDLQESGDNNNENYIIQVPFKEKRPLEDSFICVDLFVKQKLRHSEFLGDIIIQVTENGTVLPGIKEYENMSEFNLEYALQRREISKEGENVYNSQQFEELRVRKDDIAKTFNKWQKKEKIGGN